VQDRLRGDGGRNKKKKKKKKETLDESGVLVVTFRVRFLRIVYSVEFRRHDIVCIVLFGLKFTF